MKEWPKGCGYSMFIYVMLLIIIIHTCKHIHSYSSIYILIHLISCPAWYLAIRICWHRANVVNVRKKCHNTFISPASKHAKRSLFMFKRIEIRADNKGRGSNGKVGQRKRNNGKAEEKYKRRMQINRFNLDEEKETGSCVKDARNGQIRRENPGHTSYGWCVSVIMRFLNTAILWCNIEGIISCRRKYFYAFNSSADKERRRAKRGNM